MKQLTVKDFKEDFKYYLDYLHDNIAAYNDTNTDEVYKVYANYVCDGVKNKQHFGSNLMYFIRHRFDLKFYGHNMICWDSLDKETIENGIKNDNHGYKELYKRTIVAEDFYKSGPTRTEKTKIYDTSIIKNDVGEDVIMVKIDSMITPTDEEVNELKEFISEHKDLKDLYIDIRKNGGGSPQCLYSLIMVLCHETLKFQNNDIDVYFKNPFKNPDGSDVSKAKQTELEQKYPGLKEQIHIRCRGKEDSAKYDKERGLWILKQHIEPVKVVDKTFYAGYKGNVNILMSGNCFSTSQMLLHYFKGNKRFKILGNQESAGSGLIGQSLDNDDPYPYYQLFMLPNTKFVMACDFFMCDKLYAYTRPDERIPEWLNK